MKRRYWPTILLSTIAVGSIAWMALRSCPTPLVRQGITCIDKSALTPEGSNGSEDPQIEVDGELTERFSRGEKVLFKDKGNPDTKAGTEVFQKGNYQQAIASFSRAVASSRNEPEPQIYLNNAIAQAKGNPYTLAVVVPVTNRTDQAKEILRGVADSQSQFNKSGGRDDRLLEILIVDDGNEPQMAARVAAQLAATPEVLGVIGHNSSSASESALPEYEKAGLTMISPTSTSTNLEGNVFFRTIPSDEASGQRLANYVNDQLKEKQVVVFFDNGSYSKSLKAAFEAEFLGEIDREVDLGAKDPDFNTEIQNIPPNILTILLFLSTDKSDRAIGLADAIYKRPGGKRFKLLGGDSLYKSDTLVQGGEAIEGLILAVPWFSGTPYTGYAEQASQRWGGQVSWRTASSFDATQALSKVISNEASRESVLTSLKSLQLSSEETSGNPLKFTSTGNRSSEPILVKAIRGGNRPIDSEFGFEKIDD